VTKEWKWLSSTAELQLDTYGYPIFAWESMLNVGEIPRELPPYLLWNTFAIYNELAELAYEFNWKPWANDGDFVNRDRILEEAVDILHFLGNILTAVGVGDTELWKAYQEKQALNRERAKSKEYSARKGGVGRGSDAS